MNCRFVHSVRKMFAELSSLTTDHKASYTVSICRLLPVAKLPTDSIIYEKKGSMTITKSRTRIHLCNSTIHIHSLSGKYQHHQSGAQKDTVQAFWKPSTRSDSMSFPNKVMRMLCLHVLQTQSFHSIHVSSTPSVRVSGQCAI